MNQERLLKETNLVRSKLKAFGRQVSIPTQEILYHSFYLDGEYSKLRYKERVSVKGKTDYVSREEILGIYESVRFEMKSFLDSGEGNIPKSWRNAAEDIRKSISESSGKQTGSESIRSLCEGICDVIFPILGSRGRKLKFTFSSILATEALNTAGLPGILFPTDHAKQIAELVRNGDTKGFLELFMRLVSSFSHRELSRVLRPDMTISVEELKEKRGLKFLEIRPGWSWEEPGSKRRTTWADPEFIENCLSDPEFEFTKLQN